MADTPPLASWWDALADRYQPVSELRSGGMASVWLAQDVRHDRQVVVKILPDHLSHAVGRERFIREISILARLQHPNILPLIDSGETSGLLWYVTPYISGESLRTRVARDGPLAVSEAVRLGLEICDALGYAHRQRVVHRDVKPDNILLSQGHALLADFGISSLPADDRLTATGQSLGTPAYMSPEQIGGSAVDGRSDLYSLGCVLFECLTGVCPFTGPDARTLMAKHVLDPVPSILALRPVVPESVEAAVRKCLEKLPADRWRDADDFASALRKSESGGAARVGVQAMRRRGWAPTLLAGAGLALAVLAIGSAARSTRSNRQRALLEGVALSQVTYRGDVASPSLSPDGEFVVYRSGDQLWLQDLQTRAEVAVQEPSSAARALSWTADGNGVLVWSAGRVLYVPRTGSAPRLHFEVPSTERLPSPRVFMFPHAVAQTAYDVTTPAGEADDERKEAVARTRSETVQVHYFAGNPRARRFKLRDLEDDLMGLALSPDGREMVAYSEREVVMVDVGTGIEQFRRPNRHPRIQQATWLPDGRLLTLMRDSGSSFVSIGAAHNLVRGTGRRRRLAFSVDIEAVSVALNSGRLLLSKSTYEVHLWWADRTGAGWIPLTQGTGAERWPAPTARGDTIYFSSRGSLRRAVAPFAVTEAVPGDPGNTSMLQLSPDGRRLLFFGRANGFEAQVLDLTTGDIQRFGIPKSPVVIEASHIAAWLPTSRGFIAVYYNDRVARVFRANLEPDSVAEVLLETRFATNPVVAPDGRAVVLLTEAGLLSVALEDARLQRLIPIRDSSAVLPIHWARDGWIYARSAEALEYRPDKLSRVNPVSGVVEHLRTLPAWCRDLVYVEHRSQFICAKDADRTDVWLGEAAELK